MKDYKFTFTNALKIPQLRLKPIQMQKRVYSSFMMANISQ